MMRAGNETGATADPGKWIGRTRTTRDTITPGPAQRMALLLDMERAFRRGDRLPDLWHWLYFIDSVPQSRLGRDGHAGLGDFMPPVPLPRRMWAGGRFRFYAPLRIGEEAIRRSTISDIRHKTGRSGELIFVSIEHTIEADGKPRIREVQDLVYRDDSERGPGQGRPGDTGVPPKADWTESIVPDPVLLFRYSALTFNGHRIHYDRAYCTRVEGYPGLVVHGPLLATLLVHFAAVHYPDTRPASLEYRALRPLFDSDRVLLNGRADTSGIRLWAGNGDIIAMQAAIEP